MRDSDSVQRGRRAVLRGCGAFALALPLLAVSGGTAAGAVRGRGARFRVLVFSRTTGFRHASIPDGIAAIEELGAEHGFGVDATEDPEVFSQRQLRDYAAVIFLNTTGTVLDTEGQRGALESYIRAGGGYVGVHSASDTEYEWPFYERLVGAYFHTHPVQQFARFDNEVPDHPATGHLPERFTVFDEFYSFRHNPRPDVRVLLTIDERTYLPFPNTSHLPFDADGEFNEDFLPGESGYMGDHPMSWCHTNLGGPAFYTALGHEKYLYRKEWFRGHLLGGILVAASQVPADCATGRGQTT
ncbi:ThuA domain-containing protein [Haloechinothrix sp. LS1_15]|uniref:ThuA domain-containing protein n=1 Tax=Haloechinothrix sp. LS1_15 TaxID=2652248 RepID=UPI002947C85C|nr:ThuA domain-containing protein [Haloechinothrix sp. LS1_15]MDV6011313.1 ThuA domain-containing protein [Haloechinothrix sp. LS1_15]